MILEQHGGEYAICRIPGILYETTTGGRETMDLAFAVVDL
jgi:hypothetical protein